MRRKQPIPGRYISPSAIKGEKDSEIGRRIEKGQPTDPMAQRQHLAQQQQAEDWSAETALLEEKDKKEREAEIKQLRGFLQEVAQEEKKRQTEMRQRVEEIVEEKLKRQGDSTPGRVQCPSDTPGVLVEPSVKPKRGSFVARLKKKGKGAMAEAKGAIAKGGG